tara:strand:- start:433 stop:1950 length:1518 start_codon:yes stop_codon:yes gene_type:complete
MNNYALISVYDKSNLPQLCRLFKKYKIKIISTGNTAKHIKKLGYSSMEISNITKFKEILDGRVKTLHPKIHASILFKRKNKKQSSFFKKLKVPEINFVIVNLYPFNKFIKSNTVIENCVDMIDIGGTALLRSSAKNFSSVTTITNTNDYKQLIREIENNKGATTLKFRKKMALKVFRLTSLYDKNIANWFEKLTESKYYKNKLHNKLRYGENPNQKAQYLSSSKINIFEKAKLSGKEISYNNILDIDSSIKCINEFTETTCAIFKHNNPCGVGSDKNISKAFDKALNSDPLSAFGGVIIFNRKIDKNLALKINKVFFDIVIGKSFDKTAIQILSMKKKLILIDLKELNFKNRKDIRSVLGGNLIQDTNLTKISKSNTKLVSNKKRTKNVVDDLIFATRVAKHVKSNSIVLAKNKQTIGIGAGQMSRIDATNLAIMKYKKLNKSIKNFVAASDGFFPFNDSVKLLFKNYCCAIIQPSGSLNDDDVIKFANKNNITLYFLNNRLFKH